MVSLPFNKVFF